MKRLLAMSIGLFGTILSLTVLYFGMRAVMGVGGSCAEGGAYQIAVHCPDGVAMLMPLSIFVGLFSAFLYALSCPPKAPNIVFLFWSALFVSLGWNFLDFGLMPLFRGEAWDLSWTFCGIMFEVMGLAPLFFLGSSLKEMMGVQHQETSGGSVAWFLSLYAVLIGLGIWSGYALFRALS